MLHPTPKIRWPALVVQNIGFSFTIVPGVLNLNVAGWT